MAGDGPGGSRDRSHVEAVGTGPAPFAGPGLGFLGLKVRVAVQGVQIGDELMGGVEGGGYRRLDVLA